MLRSVRNAESITVTLRGGVGELERACEEVGSFLVEQGLGGCRFELGLLIREALCNCIIHGGRERGDARTVNLKLAIDGREAVITVEDDGPGWKWRTADYDCPSKEAVSGRGMFIMDHYSNGIEFNEAGNRVVIRKNLATCQGEAT